jgi:hypothetical protein
MASRRTVMAQPLIVLYISRILLFQSLIHFALFSSEVGPA